MSFLMKSMFVQCHGPWTTISAWATFTVIHFSQLFFYTRTHKSYIKKKKTF